MVARLTTKKVGAISGSRTTKILVTGATGFIGQQAVARLLADGYHVRVALRHTGSVPMAWKAVPELELMQVGDLALASLEPVLDGVNCVVHLAGAAHMARSHRADAAQQFFRANAEATRRLTEAARRGEVRTFIHASSLASITANASDRVVDDSMAERPTSAYGTSKLMAEMHVRSLAEAGCFAISLRPPLVIGAAAKGNWAALQGLAATGLPLPFASVANRRSFISIQTLVEIVGLLCCGKWESSLSGEYCIADPDLLSLPQVVRELRRGMGKPARLFPCPPRLFHHLGSAFGRQRQLAALTGSLRVDSSRFSSVFNFVSPMPLDEAIRLSGAAYRKATGTFNLPMS